MSQSRPILARVLRPFLVSSSKGFQEFSRGQWVFVADNKARELEEKRLALSVIFDRTEWTEIKIGQA